MLTYTPYMLPTYRLVPFGPQATACVVTSGSVAVMSLQLAPPSREMYTCGPPEPPMVTTTRLGSVGCTAKSVTVRCGSAVCGASHVTP